MREGKGVHFYKTGDIYEGIWHKDKRQGLGKLIFRDQSIYQGEFNQDRAEGRGKYLDKKRNFFSTLTIDGLPRKEEESEMASDKEGWRGKNRRKKWSEAVEYQKLRALLLHEHRMRGPALPGCFVDGRLTGIGTIKFASGDEYIGEFKEGNRSGVGLMVYHNLRGVAGDHDQAVYLGEWKANQRDGWGRQTWMDGSQFEGQWKKDERVHGQMIMANKDEYNGHFKEDKFHGYGELKISKGRVFAGYFKEGQSPGKGTIRYHDGSFYQGEVITPMVFSEQLQAREFLKQGRGRMEYANGDIYEGEWREDKNSGKGSKLYANGDHYEGQFFENQRQGDGRMFYSQSKHFYDGSWVQDQRSGFGILVDQAGEVYRGGWKNDRQEGSGSNY